MASTKRLEEHLGYLLNRTAGVWTANGEEVFLAHGVSAKKVGCLYVIADEGPISQRAMAKRVGVDRTTAVTVVDELEQEGYVSRRRDAGDRRAYALTITAKGRRKIDVVSLALKQLDDQLSASLDVGEQRHLIAILQKLMDAHEFELE